MWTIHVGNKKFILTKGKLRVIIIVFTAILTLFTINAVKLIKIFMEKEKIKFIESESKKLQIEEKALKFELLTLSYALKEIEDIEKRARIAWDAGEHHKSYKISPEWKEDSIFKVVALNYEIRKKSMNELWGKISAVKRRLRHTPSIWPTRGVITSKYGWRYHPILKKREFHKGVDIANKVGTPIVAPADGIVKWAGWKPGYGWFLVINHGYGYETAYGHLSRIIVKPKQYVRRGQIVAYMGASGLATGPHLHYEVRINRKPVNPLNYMY